MSHVRQVIRIIGSTVQMMLDRKQNDKLTEARLFELLVDRLTSQQVKLTVEVESRRVLVLDLRTCGEYFPRGDLIVEKDGYLHNKRAPVVTSNPSSSNEYLLIVLIAKPLKEVDCSRLRTAHPTPREQSMLARGMSSAAGRAPLSAATMAAKFSSQALRNSSWRMKRRFVIPRKGHWSYKPCSSAFDSNGSKNGGITSSDIVEREYADLNLKDLYGAGQIGHVRIRQHVNPLGSSFSVPVKVANWDDVFNNSKLPLMVDIGSADPALSVLGERNFSQKYCPDPHFKKRHHKRRVLQKPLVDSILNNLITGGQVLLQSDVLQVAMDMRDQFDLRIDLLKHIDAIDDSFSCDEDGWLQYNPIGIRTEREIHAELQGAKIYRRLYQKI
ncbi:hypothetical protein IEQ34_022527 [Dendrobium chrysotoxum]|uniref:tRNA (guanine(46)-N(7))-methyltransferase n=1 Tax=Dendrobium chrysotoxum TaxID=161865 RepID=A0AAV7FZ87_DENCH|nr:hypothetical protein IEQ34_022527 [Dendrobium chrysotoxum]